MYEKLQKNDPDMIGQAGYEAFFVKQLHENSMTVQEFIVGNVQKRVNDAEESLINKLKPSAEQLDLKSFYIGRMIKYEQQRGFRLFECDKRFPKDLYLYVKELFSAVGVNNGIFRITYSENQVACVRNIGHPLQVGKIDDSLMRYELFVGPLFFELTREAQKGILLHEIMGHVYYADPLKADFYKKLRKKATLSFDLYNQFIRYSEIEKLLAQYSRAIEARADQIPAVEFSINECKGMRNFFEERLSKEEKLRSNFFKIRIDFDDQHDPVPERLRMVQHIENLRIVEEQWLRIEKDAKNKYTIEKIEYFLNKIHFLD